MAAVLEVKYFNSFWLKKVIDTNEAGGDAYLNAVYPGTNPNGYNLGGAGGATTVIWPAGGVPGSTIVNSEERNWEIEEARIRGGFNNAIVDLGVKAYIEEEEPESFRRTSSIIYSGVFNSRTGVNQTNQFPTGSDITKTADPHNGSIQRLYAENNDLTIFQENKVSRALIDKDAIYSAEGGGTVTSSQVVIGQIIPYVGNYGISKNPESFAVYGYRKYFADKFRGVVLRLSRDGITEISSYGMFDYFRDRLAEITNTNTVYENEGWSGSTGVNITDVIIGETGFIPFGTVLTFPQTPFPGLPVGPTLVSLTGGSGAGAIAEVSVDILGNITAVITFGGVGYIVGNILRIPANTWGPGTNPDIDSDPITVVNGSTYTGEVPRLGSLISIRRATGITEVQPDVYVINAGVTNLLPPGKNTVIELNSGVTLEDGDVVIFTILSRPRMPGGWDIHNKQYTLSLQDTSNYLPIPDQPDTRVPTVGYSTLVFDEAINGWVSFYSFNPVFMGSLKDKFYSMNGTIALNGDNSYIWQHYTSQINRFNEEENYQTFYGLDADSNITFVFNPSPSISKNFLTVNYEGTNGWEVDYFVSGFQGYETLDGTPASPPNNIYNQYQDSTAQVKSLQEGLYYENGIPYHSGFYIKENRYVANLVNNSETMPGEVIFGPNGVINNSNSGIKGFFATVKISTDSSTYPGGPKELYAVGSVYQPSAY
jgi:hypothetical protein